MNRITINLTVDEARLLCDQCQEDLKTIAESKLRLAAGNGDITTVLELADRIKTLTAIRDTLIDSIRSDNPCSFDCL